MKTGRGVEKNFEMTCINRW